MSKSSIAAAVLVVAVTTGQGAAAAGTSNENILLNDRVTISLGTFLLDSKIRASVNGSLGNTGDVVDLDRDLGLKDTDRLRLDASWRFAERHKLRLMYFDTKRSGITTIDRDITIGDTTFPVNGEVTSKTSNSITELAYEYSLIRHDNWELAANIGVHRAAFRLSVAGAGTVNGVPGQFRTETRRTKAPLPLLGVRVLRALGNNWYLDGQVQYFALKIGKYDGRITDFRAGVTRMFGDHFGLGAGYDYFSTRVNVDSAAFDGRLRWRYSGAQIFLTGSF